MKTNNALQVIFAFFLGLVLVAFIGIGVNTFYPEPDWSSVPESGHANWRLVTGIILLVCATVVLAVSLLMPEDQGVLSNGVLLGGVFTMVYSVGITLSSDRSVLRFVMIALALAVTIGIGYFRFVRGRRRAAAASAPVPVPTDASPGGAVPVETAALADRLAAVERKLDALGRALQ